jgi:hypothetical protein
MSSVHARAVRPTSQPSALSGIENPKPGSEGITTWKASAGSPPWARGSVRAATARVNSTNELG